MPKFIFTEEAKSSILKAELINDRVNGLDLLLTNVRTGETRSMLNISLNGTLSFNTLSKFWAKEAGIKLISGHILVE